MKIICRSTCVKIEECEFDIAPSEIFSIAIFREASWFKETQGDCDSNSQRNALKS
jgi:hypothetical protein